MLRLDHFVIHIDYDDQKMQKLKKDLDDYGIPFDPDSGKDTKGFKIANLWIGDQYLELPYLKKEDGGSWKKEWVSQYNGGKRGIFGICLYTDSLDDIKQGLHERGLEIEGPERMTSRLFGGIVKKVMPHRTVYTKPIPNSNLQFMFQQMDDEKKYQYSRKNRMKPNTEDVGIVSICEAFIMKDFSREDWAFIETVFPYLEGTQYKKTLHMGETKMHFVQDPYQELSVELKAKVEEFQYSSTEIEIENVRLLIG